MQIGTPEHYSILKQFEKDAPKYTYFRGRLDREKDVEMWKKGQVYEDGETNNLYKAYILGYAFAKASI